MHETPNNAIGIMPLPASDAVAGPAQARPTHRPELIAPAGDWDCARAAVENGADAIYFGLEKHNARMRARNFTTLDLPALMAFLHRRGVKGYVTFNTLVFANELAEAEQWLRTLIAAGADAAIVQDVGICRLIRRLSPDFPIHASTQMTVTSAAGMKFARDLGCNRVVLARECSVREIQKIQAALAEGSPSPLAPRPPPLSLEVFVHGALCVAYSGQCLTSESLGGRSANRGVCAQACRMPYDLIADGQPVPLGDRRYLLSPRDLAGLELLPALVRAGVASLKIEGRLKSPEYVANITRIYRQALDAWTATAPTETAERLAVAGQTRYDMEMAFSRGLHTGWLGGLNNQELVHARFGKKRGVFLGEVSRLEGQAVSVRLTGPLKPGDGVVFDAGHPEKREEGGRVYKVTPGSARWPDRSGERNIESWLAFGHGDIDFRRIHVGDKLWKTSDPELDRRLRQTYAGDQPHWQCPIALDVRGRVGQPLTLIARDELGHAVELASALPLAEARNQALTTERLREQLGRLGGTPFRLGGLNNQLAPDAILPVSELNRLRRDVVTRLEHLRACPPQWTLNPAPAAGAARGLSAGTPPAPDGGVGRGEPRVQLTCCGVDTSWDRSADNLVRLEGCANQNADKIVRAPGNASCTPEPPASPGSPDVAELSVLVRTLPQLEAALRGGATRIYCEFEDPRKYRDAVRLVRCAQGGGEVREDREARPTIWVAPPRIAKPGEDWILHQVRSCDADGYLVRNYDHLQFFAGCPCVGDYSLNIANALSAEYFIDRFRLERVTASYDLNVTQLEALLQSAPPEWIEVTLHQHMPMFHMEHCVFCAFLSQGTDYTNCGRPCDRHEVRLRDRVGADHLLKADAGCRNTVFNALAQTGAESVSRFLALGLRHVRIEFLDEPPEPVVRTIACYRRLLRGDLSGTQLWRELKLLNQLGVTRGQLEKIGG